MGTSGGRFILRHFSRILALFAIFAMALLALRGLLSAETPPELVEIPVTLKSYEPRDSYGLQLRFAPYQDRMFIVERLRPVDLQIFKMAQRDGDSFHVLVPAADMAGSTKVVKIHGLRSPRNEYLSPRGDGSERQKQFAINLFLLLGSLGLGGWQLLAARRLVLSETAETEAGAAGEATDRLEAFDPFIVFFARFLPSRIAWVAEIRQAQSTDEEKRRIKTKAEVPRELQAVHKLLKSPGGIDAENEQGQTAVHIAALAGRTEALDVLLRHGAAINKKDKEGKTALILATEKGMHLGVVTKLLERGADVSIADSAKMTALDYANANKKEAFAQVLLRASKAMPALLKAAGAGKLAEALALVKLGHDVNTRAPETGETALILAAKGDHLGVARMLLEHGADQALKDASGRTAMAQAEAGNRRDMIALLTNPPARIDRNAEASAEEKSGEKAPEDG